MRHTDVLYQTYLEEMQALESFRMTYASANPAAKLDREDPDVRRMIEAMALFNARTRSAAMKGILASSRRLFQQFFSYIVTPLPAMAMLEARTNSRFSEPVTVPCHTEVQIEPAAGMPATFRTTRDLRILPIRVTGVTTLLRAKSGLRHLIRFEAAHERNDEIGTLQININHLNNYQTSLQVIHAFRMHLEGASVHFTHDVDGEARGTSIEVEYGAPRDAEPSLDQPHPLQRVRTAFHFPEQDLFVSCKVPRPPRNWKRFTIALDVDAKWPRNMRLNEDIFRLAVVPIENLKKASAQPFVCDGTQERYLIRHPQAKIGYALHSVLGVYEITKEGLVPLRPGILGGGRGTFEVERDTIDGGQEATWLHLRMPDAFRSPRKIAVDGLWYQPGFSQLSAQKLDVGFYDRDIAGVTLELQSDVRPHLENPLRNDADGLLQVLALKNRADLSLDDIGILANALGSVRASHLRGIVDLFQKLEVNAVPLAGEGRAGVKRVFRFELAEFDATQRAAVEVALGHLLQCLDAWTGDAAVELEASVPGTDVKFTLGKK